MLKDVWISISNHQSHGPTEEDTLVFDTVGSYFFNDGIGVLSYQESELTGRMVFREGTRDSYPYQTPYGQMMLGIDTRSIRPNFNENGGDVEIDYITDLAHTVVARNKFRISVKEMEKANG